MIIADTVLLNGKVATVDRNFSFKRAIAVKNGWIIDVGENWEIQAYVGRGTNIIDLKGKVILPGIHDAHVHLSDYIDNLHCLDCGRTRIQTLDELRAILSERARTLPPGTWIRGTCLESDCLAECREEGRSVTCHDLDPVTPYHPVIITFRDGHNFLANSKAMEICGITRDTPDLAGEKIGRDEKGELNGIFQEVSALQLIFSKIPRLTVDEIKNNLVEGQQLLNSWGYTSYTDCLLGPANNNRESGASGERAIFAYRKLQEEGLMTARVSLGFYSGQDGRQSYDILKRDLDNFPFPDFPDRNWLDLRLIKLFCDGLYMTHTAWMKEDYADAPGWRGKSCFLSPEASDEEQEQELRKIIQLVHDRGYQVGIHAIGNRAVKAAVEAIIAAQQTNPGKSRRHYLIHGDVLGDREDLWKAVKHGIGISAQSALADYNYEIAIERCGLQKGEALMGLRHLVDMGFHIANGSDAVGGEYGDWRHTVQAAVTRRSRVTGKVHRPDLAITVEEAIRQFTMGGAYQEYMEDVRGSIEPGKVADFTVLDRDIFTIDPETIDQTKIVMTMVDGKVVYRTEL